MGIGGVISSWAKGGLIPAYGGTKTFHSKTLSCSSFVVKRQHIIRAFCTLYKDRCLGVQGSADHKTIVSSMDI